MQTYWRHVNANGGARLPDLIRSEKNVQPAATAEVKHDLPLKAS